jgi:DNA-3-methyladenine glycosylase
MPELVVFSYKPAMNYFRGLKYNKLKKLTAEFYKRQDVVLIARELLGKIMVTNMGGTLTSGRIVEAEAYSAVADKASHACAGRRTASNEAMYAKGGTLYVYICYGMHQMCNVVTNKKEVPDAILIRGLEPLQGIDTMLLRTPRENPGFTLTKGPGNVGRAMGINKAHTGTSLLGNDVYIADDGFEPAENTIGISPRIGVDYAGEDALLPYRFYIRGNRYVSGRPVK